MKFGKDLEQYVSAGWEESYIDYKALKTVLKRLEGKGEKGGEGKEVSKREKDEVDSEFFLLLEDSLEKVNKAFLAKCKELENALDTQQAGDTLVAQFDAAANLNLDGEPNTKKFSPSAASSSQTFEERTARIRREADESAFFEAYRTLGRLQTFVWINAKGFQKIMKKYDKHTRLRGTGHELGPLFDKRLEKEAFMGGKLDILNELFKQRRPALTPMALRAPGGGGGGGQHMQLLSGNANPELAGEISARLGVPLTPVSISQFHDGEVSIQILENVRNSDVYIIQPTCPPVNNNLMELLLCASAVRRAAAARVTAVVPYYGYARQDRKERSRVPISAADVAKMMEAMGVDRVCCVDLHCGQIQGFFGPRTPVDNLWATPIAISYFMTRQLQNVAVVSPDAGGVARAKMFKEGLEAQGIKATLAMIIKQRHTNEPNDRSENKYESGPVDLVGTVQGCDCIIVDDMIDTGSTISTAANELISFGANKVFAFATHGIFNPPAAERIEASALEELVIANTIPLPASVNRSTRKVRQISVGKLIAQAIKCIHTGDSVKGLFDVKKGHAFLA